MLTYEHSYIAPPREFADLAEPVDSCFATIFAESSLTADDVIVNDLDLDFTNVDPDEIPAEIAEDIARWLS